MAESHENERAAGNGESDSEFTRLTELYDELNDAGYFAHEFMWAEKKYGAAVGTWDDLTSYLGVETVDDITEEMMRDLPPFLLFAAPGGGLSRTAAIEEAYQTMLQIEAARRNAERERTRLSISARDALFSAEEGEVRIVRADSIISGRLVPTGETILETYEYGGKTMSFNREVAKLRIEKEFIEIAPELQSSALNSGTKRRGISEQEFRNFAYPGFNESLATIDNTIVTEFELREWATEAIQSAEDYERTSPCSNCKGKGEFVGLRCRCTQANSITDMVTGDVSYDKDDELPDPDCTECGGTGEWASTCPICEGAKEILTYPTLELYDPATEQTRTIRFDLAAMIREYPEGLYVEYQARDVGQFGYGLASKSVWFDLAGYLKKDVVGLDDDEKLYVKHTGEDYVFQFDEAFRPLPIDRVSWNSNAKNLLRGRQSITQTNRQAKAEIIGEAQQELARELSLHAGRENSRNYDLQYVPSAEVRLADLRALAAHYGFGIGSSLEGFETGTRAYTLYLVDAENNFVAALGQSYDSDDTIETSWRSLQKLIAAGSLK